MYVVRPILPRCLLVQFDGQPSSIEASVKNAAAFCEAHNLQFGLMSGRVYVDIPPELFGCVLHTREDAIAAAGRIEGRYKFKVAVLEVINTKLYPVFEVGNDAA